MQQNHSISAKRHIHYRLYQLPPFFDSLRNYTNLWPCPVVCLFLGASQPASLRNGWRHLYSHQHLPDGKPNWTPFEKVKLQMIRVSAHCYNYIYVYIYTIFIYICVSVAILAQAILAQAIGLRQGYPTTVHLPVCLSGFFGANPRAYCGPCSTTSTRRSLRALVRWLSLHPLLPGDLHLAGLGDTIRLRALQPGGLPLAGLGGAWFGSF